MLHATVHAACSMQYETCKALKGFDFDLLGVLRSLLQYLKIFNLIVNLYCGCTCTVVQYNNLVAELMPRVPH